MGAVGSSVSERIISTANFGDLRVSEDQLLLMPRGMIGIPDTEWVLLTREPDSPFVWLQSAQDPQCALPVTAPEMFFPDYQLALPEQALEGLGIDSEDTVEALCVVRATEQLTDFTINLRGPLIFNAATRVGAQVVNAIDYPVQQPLWEQRGINQLTVTHPNLPVVRIPEVSC